MKKIININLSGRVIPIEDSAYEKLQGYIESLRRHFAKEESRDEIINDIESRIAELMSEKIRKGASAITEADVEEIADSMGRPEDLADAEETTSYTKEEQKEQYQSTSAYTSEKRKKRLYRDSGDKMIGGVCSGIAAYLNIDTAIIRILFAIITFGGFGLGFLVYILLWIILPAEDVASGYTGKRLYRNPEDRVIGGVASGLAAYFNRNTTTIRLIFVAPILLNILFNVIDGFSWRHGFDFFPNIVFGSLSGTFVLAYIVLWIVLPEAHSTYEKMEMRGEKVDVNSISQNVKEGADSMKERMKDWTEEVKESAHNFSKKAKEFANTRGKTFASEVSSTARSGGRGLGHVIGVVFKAFFLFIAGTIAFALFCALIGLLFGGVAWWPVNGFLWTSKWQQLYAWGTLIFFLIVPLVGFIMWVVRRIIRVRSKSNYLGWTFGFLWTIGWVSAILLAASVWNDFSEYKYSEQPLSITQPVKGKMILAVSKPELEYTGRFGWLNDGGDGWDLSTDTLRMSTVRFRVIASTDSQYHVVLRRYSYGKTTADAISRAEDIQYSAYSRDSILDLDNGYTISKQSKFRFQQIEIEVQVPIGKKIRFDHSVTDKLNPMNFWVERKRRNNRSVRLDINDERSFIFAVDTDYTMGVDGNLTDPSGRTLYDNYYRNYRGNDDNLERQLEREKQKLEESERRTKELEERLNEKKKSTEAKPESMDDKDEVSMSGSSSPVVSLVSWIY